MIELTHYRISQAQLAAGRAKNQWFKDYWLNVVEELKTSSRKEK